jgi:hypothetical protein
MMMVAGVLGYFPCWVVHKSQLCNNIDVFHLRVHYSVLGQKECVMCNLLRKEEFLIII